MLIGLSGTHGTGKSTVLQSVKHAGFSVSEVSLSRNAQKSLGWDTLSVAQESVDNMWALQDAVLAALQERDRAICESGELVLVERSPADLWAYLSMWCRAHQIDAAASPRVARYYDALARAALAYNTVIVIPTSDSVPFVQDPNRADFESREYVADTINNFLRQNEVSTHVMRQTSRGGRAVEAIAIMRQACV